MIALRERAAAELRRGDTGAAEATARLALASSTAIHGADGWPTIALHALLGAIHEARGRWADAVAAYEQEIALTERRLGGWHQALAPRLLAYAVALRRAGREEEARAAEIRAHRIYAAAETADPVVRDP